MKVPPKVESKVKDQSSKRTRPTKSPGQPSKRARPVKPKDNLKEAISGNAPILTPLEEIRAFHLHRDSLKHDRRRFRIRHPALVKDDPDYEYLSRRASKKPPRALVGKCRKTLFYDPLRGVSIPNSERLHRYAARTDRFVSQLRLYEATSTNPYYVGKSESLVAIHSYLRYCYALFTDWKSVHSAGDGRFRHKFSLRGKLVSVLHPRSKIAKDLPKGETYLVSFNLCKVAKYFRSLLYSSSMGYRLKSLLRRALGLYGIWKDLLLCRR